MKLKLSDLALVADLVTIDSYEVLSYDSITTPGTIKFELANETLITLLDKEVEFTDNDDAIQFVTDDDVIVVCEFFMHRNIRVADMLENLSNLK